MILLGAGAVADAGYPTAKALIGRLENEAKSGRWGSDLSSLFESHLAAFRESLESVGELSLPPPLQTPNEGRLYDVGTLAYPSKGAFVFAPTGAEHRSAGVAKEPYLEDFFAYWDWVYQTQNVALWSDEIKGLHPGNLHTRRKLMRDLRDEAVWLVYDLLDPMQNREAVYLEDLLTLPGPDPATTVICTLNFDLEVERLAKGRGMSVNSGFQRMPTAPPPPSWYGQLPALWKYYLRRLESYVGFQTSAEADVELLKIHGSLGWFRMEEGSGDIGWSDVLRDNVRVTTLRFSPDEMLKPGQPIHHFSGKEGFGSIDGEEATGKSGAIWLRPDLVFARSRKLVVTGPMLELITRLSHWLGDAARILVVGYAWRDPHINDLILHHVSRGLNVITVGGSPVPENLLPLLANKFPTTHRKILHQFSCLGGGAQSVFASKVAVTPGGQEEGVSLEQLTDESAISDAFSLAEHAEKLTFRKEPD